MLRTDMTRSELTSALAKRFPLLVYQDADMAVKEILAAISATMVRNGRVEIRGFGVFCLNYRPPRIGRNPKTGQRVSVRSMRMPHFKPGKDLREGVDIYARTPMVLKLAA